MTQIVAEKMDMTEAMLDAWRRNLEAMGWARDQGEKVLRMWAEQGKITQEECARMMERAAELATRQQEEMQKYVQATLQMSLAALKLPTVEEVDKLKQQVAELQAKVAELSK
jgi:polyhydroxyalkanoate synthesis regulator phasin